MTDRRICVDFNTMMSDQEQRVYLPTRRNQNILEILYPGIKVVLFEPFDIEVDALVEYDTEDNTWYGRPDWMSKRNLQSDTLERIWGIINRLAKLRDVGISGDPEEAALRENAAVIWTQLTKDEQAWVRLSGSWQALYGQENALHSDHSS